MIFLNTGIDRQQCSCGKIKLICHPSPLHHAVFLNCKTLCLFQFRISNGGFTAGLFGQRVDFFWISLFGQVWKLTHTLVQNQANKLWSTYVGLSLLGMGPWLEWYPGIWFERVQNAETFTPSFGLVHFYTTQDRKHHSVPTGAAVAQRLSSCLASQFVEVYLDKNLSPNCSWW